MAERVAVVGTGLIGGSLGLALARVGYEAPGSAADAPPPAPPRDSGGGPGAAAGGAHAARGAHAAFVALPVSSVAGAVVACLDAGAEVVSDVGSVKGPVVEAVERERPAAAARFVGGHPMAGSEQEGIAGADADVFSGATWVLTPSAHTDTDAFARVRGIVASLGAHVVAVDPAGHDELVAVVSHVPHLAAGTLMLLAVREAGDRAALMRLAAGGFRDMTRIAAGHPGIWPDICAENRDAIVHGLDRYVAKLTRIRDLVAAEDRQGLLEVLEEARSARVSLPVRPGAEESLVELRVPVTDRPGVLAEVTTLAGRLGVNIADLEIAPSAEGGGVLVMVVPAAGAEAVESELTRRGYRSSRRPLE